MRLLKYCENCGSEVTVAQNFCNSCGSRLTNIGSDTAILPPMPHNPQVYAASATNQSFTPIPYSQPYTKFDAQEDLKKVRSYLKYIIGIRVFVGLLLPLLYILIQQIPEDLELDLGSLFDLQTVVSTLIYSIAIIIAGLYLYSHMNKKINIEILDYTKYYGFAVFGFTVVSFFISWIPGGGLYDIIFGVLLIQAVQKGELRNYLSSKSIQEEEAQPLVVNPANQAFFDNFT